MLNARLNLFFSHWHSARGKQELPAAADLDPGMIKSLVSDSFILSRDDNDDFRYRHAGTHHVGRYRRDLIGRSFLGHWQNDDRRSAAKALTAMSYTTLFGHMKIKGFSDQGQPISLETLMLPVVYPGEKYFRIMGLMVSEDRPYWLGLNPIVSHETKHLRLRIPPQVVEVSDEVIAFDEPLRDGDTWSWAGAPRPSENRPSFTVIEGGRQ